MQYVFVASLVLYLALAVGGGAVLAQEKPAETGSLSINLGLPDYTLEPTTSSTYKKIIGQYLVLKSVTVIPSSDSATFEWKITRSKGASTPTVRIEYGTEDTSAHTASFGDGTTEKTPSGGMIVKNLQPNTEYRFLLVASFGTLYNKGTMVRSQELRFTTPATGSDKKIVTQLSSPRIKLKTFRTTKTSAKLAFQTDVPTTATYEYAEFKPYFVYTDKKEDSVSGTAHTFMISGLKPNTMYPYRIIARTSDGRETAFDGFVFKTKALAPVTALAASKKALPVLSLGSTNLKFSYPKRYTVKQDAENKNKWYLMDKKVSAILVGFIDNNTYDTLDDWEAKGNDGFTRKDTKGTPFARLVDKTFAAMVHNCSLAGGGEISSCFADDAKPNKKKTISINGLKGYEMYTGAIEGTKIKIGPIYALDVSSRFSDGDTHILYLTPNAGYFSDVYMEDNIKINKKDRARVLTDMKAMFKSVK